MALSSTFRPGSGAPRRLLQPVRSASTTADRLIPAPRTRAKAGERSRAPPASVSGIGSRTEEPEPLRTFAAEGLRRQARPKPRPTTPSLHRVRAALSSAGARPRPRAIVLAAARRGFTGQGPNGGKRYLTVPGHVRRITGILASAREHTTPARSARTPLVVRPSPRWVETPAQASRSHRTIPPREGRGSPIPDASLARTSPRPRAALPTLPRRRARPAEPEVPSIGEPDTAATRPKLRLRQPERNEPVR